MYFSTSESGLVGGPDSQSSPPPFVAVVLVAPPSTVALVDFVVALAVTATTFLAVDYKQQEQNFILSRTQKDNRILSPGQIFVPGTSENKMHKKCHLSERCETQ
jgi:hypothetical protein